MLEENIYLDNAATTFPKSEAIYKAMDDANRRFAVNAGRGSYKLAREANAIIDDTKERLLRLVSASSTSKVVFTSSITISLNMILQGITWQKGDIVYVSPYEHNAVARTLEKLKNDFQIVVKLMPLTEEFDINLPLLESLFITDRPKCVCCTGVSNVTGYILPTKEIFKAAKECGAITILDSAQSLGLIEQKLDDIDFLAFAGHKTLYGPFGIGGFIDNSRVKLKQVIVGGTGSNSLILSMPEETPNRYESSSPNIVAIAGLNAALEELDVNHNFKFEKELTEYAIEKLEEISNIRIYKSQKMDSQIGIISFNIRNSGLSADDIGNILDEEFGIAVRTGYHCAPYIHNLLGDIEYSGTVRIGLGKFNTREHIDALCDALENIV